MGTVPDPAWLPVEVFRTGDSEVASAAETVLDDAGIAFVTKRSSSFGAPLPFAVSQSTPSDFVFMVAGESAAEARRAIQRLPRPTRTR